MAIYSLFMAFLVFMVGSNAFLDSIQDFKKFLYCHTRFPGCHTSFLGCHTRTVETKKKQPELHHVYFVHVYQPLHGILETRKKCIENLATVVRSCYENFVWRVWNHIWLLDMVAKKGQRGNRKNIGFVYLLQNRSFPF